jgi:mono/diheme cytochrome c family protein
MSQSGGHIHLGKFFLGSLLCVVALALGVYLCLRLAPLPVAVADRAFPFERQIVKIPLRARISRDLKHAPFDTSEAVFESGAHIYHEQCAVCHGVPDHDSPYAKRMYPSPPQLWKRSRAHGPVGVSDYEPGLAYWFVANGVRLTGMPAFSGTLSETEMWQVSLLLKNADKTMPAPVSEILNDPNP